ncbi:MAG: S-adenosylmethionine:tRNA ribosyltransferase-isomerase [Bacillota bacterium]
MLEELRFDLPEHLEAGLPPEARGVRRDHVRLMVTERASGRTLHTRFDRIGTFLRPGDLLVANDSRTLPAALPAFLDRRRASDAQPVEVRLAHRHQRSWTVLLKGEPDEDGRPTDVAVEPGDRLLFLPPPGPASLAVPREPLEALVLAPHPAEPRLWQVRFNRQGAELLQAIHEFGRPVRYSYARGAWDLDYYQTVYAAVPGSAEMPSAGRAFTWELLLRLRAEGVGLAFITLHTGLSALQVPEIDRLHLVGEEEYAVPPATAEAVNRTRRAGGRVVAVGTTVVRALETVADRGGLVAAGSGWTRLRITPAHRLRAVDGLLSGLHEPEASHLDMLAAFLSPLPLRQAYGEALERGYLWHEFGDEHLIV